MVHVTFARLEHTFNVVLRGERHCESEVSCSWKNTNSLTRAWTQTFWSGVQHTYMYHDFKYSINWTEWTLWSSYNQQCTCTFSLFVIIDVGDEHFQDLMSSFVSSFSGNSLHFEHDEHWTQNGMIISETYTLMFASFCPFELQSSFHFMYVS